MIATYQQVASEMRIKEAEFSSELQRAQYTQSKMVHRLTKLVGKVRRPRVKVQSA